MCKQFHIVAIGASAGGLKALEQFFSAMPPDSGMAFVVIQHLSPDFKSLMDDLLARHTDMPIHQAKEGIQLEPNTIYLSPPRLRMGVESGRITLRENLPSVPAALGIDAFFRSLAEDVGNRGIAIILSGTGSDGSRGIPFIRDAGGLVIIQSPDSAQFDGMPRNAIASGCYDFKSTPERMPRLLIEYGKDPDAVRSRISHAVEVFHDEGEFAEIFALLRRGFNVDFSRYKATTVGRRIRRRIEMKRLSSINDYAAILTSDQEELAALYSDLLIGVTEFFRDPLAFEYLATTIVPELFSSVPPPEELRIWSSCCATGEEAYSLAILFAEEAERVGYRGKITIFATDVHKHAIEIAAACAYGRDRIKNVSPERLECFFRQEPHDTWRPNQEIRQMVVFAPHNVLTDPPFTKTDLICCRNMMIYLEPEVQERVIATFHYALKVSGVLFLGSSEGLGAIDAEFETLEARHKVYRKKREVRMPMDFAVSPQQTFQVAKRPPSHSYGSSVNLDRQLLNDYDLLLDRHIPTGVIVDENRSVLHYFGDMQTYFKPTTGRTDLDVLSNIADELLVAVSTTLQRAIRNRETSMLGGVPIMREGGATAKITVSVEPLYDQRSKMSHYFVGFRSDESSPLPLLPPQIKESTDVSEEESIYRYHISDLELELKLTRENLQASNEELQASNEELQATNEELLASNEELQSTNEELHSVNEELFTVNSEFERKNIELRSLNYDHDNLLLSIDVGTVFVDTRLCIRKFNAAVSGFFRLVPHDVGRPIEHIAYHLSDQSRLMEDIRTVLSTGTIIEKEDAAPFGSRYILIRILPFRTDIGTIAGAVVLFTDITRVKEAEMAVKRLNEELKESYAELDRKYEVERRDREQTRVELQRREDELHDLQQIIDIVTFTWDLKSGAITLSDSVRYLYPQLDTHSPLEAESFFTLVSPEERIPLQTLAYSLNPGESRRCDIRLVVPDGTTRHFVCLIRRRDDDSHPHGLLTGKMVDITR